MTNHGFLDQLNATRAFADITKLADDIGVRLAGTPAETAGAAYLADQFRVAGLQPWEELFPIPIWFDERTSLTVDERDIPAISACFSGRTGADGVTGEVVAVGDPMSADQFDRGDLAGKIAMIDGRNVYFDYPDYWQTDLLVDQGVVGVIYAAGEHQLGGLPQAYHNFKRALHQPTPPTAIISYLNARLLAASSGAGVLTIEGSVEWSDSRSVFADLPGSDLANELVIVCAHHDSVRTSPGAFDNAGGCAIVAELARVFATGPQPRRTIRFVHWGGHEVGLFGSETWLHQNVHQIGRIAAVINFDGQGILEGVDHASLLGSPSWQQLASATLGELSIPVEIGVGGGGVDAVNFAALGRNTINFSRWGLVANHTASDNLDPLDPIGLEPAMRLSAALLDVVANGDDLDLTDAPPGDQLRETQAGCARWGWGITG